MAHSISEEITTTEVHPIRSDFDGFSITVEGHIISTWLCLTFEAILQQFSIDCEAIELYIAA